MLDRDAFIPKITIDLVNAIHAADNKPLQIKFRRDAEKQIEIQRVVMRDERSRRGAAVDRLHHRRFNFNKPARIQLAPQ